MKDKLPLLLFPCAAAVLDGCLTVLGLPGAGMNGAGGIVHEANPLGHLLLSISPGLFLGCLAVWILLFIGLILWLPLRAAAVASMIICGGHLIGASSWLFQYPAGIAWVVLLWLAARFLMFPSYERRIRRQLPVLAEA